MQTLLLSSLLLSVFHALIPSHWLPVLAISRQEHWSVWRTLRVTLQVGLAHVLSTVVLGLTLAALGGSLSHSVEAFTHWVAPALLVALGIFYLWQHYHHHHFHLQKQQGKWGVVASLTLAMFFSPCLEIEGFFLSAGAYGWGLVLLIAALYAVVTLLGMLIWVRVALSGLQRLDSHAWEHYAGVITGGVLVVSGLLLFVLE